MPSRRRSLSRQALELLSVMLEDPRAEYYGLELCRRAELLSGTVYPLLRRLEQRGWLTARLEDVDSTAAGRPPRVLYRLTGEGERAARAEVFAVRQALTRPWTAGGPS